MSKSNFLQIQINFSEQNHCSVFFAHLQNTLKKVSQPLKNDAQFDKICRIMLDIFKQHEKLQTAYEEMGKTMKQMMKEFSSMLNQCKQDREKLMQATKQKYDMLQKLKQCNDDAIEISSQNQQLKQTVEKLKQLNGLLVQKNQVTQEQLANRVVAQMGAESFERISKQYDRLLQSNSSIRKQLIKITNQTQAINQISIPMQIINKALQSNSKIKDQIWHTSCENGAEDFKFSQERLKQIKKSFYSFNFDEFLNKIKQGNAT